jgi:hypothetical protein
MRIFRLVVVIAIVLSLLVAASVPAYASKDKPPGKKEKPVQVKPKKPKPPKPKDQSQPDPDDAPGEDSQEMVTICHKPGTPAEQTLEIAAAALQAHLDHGDYEGACVESEVPPADEPDVDAQGKVTICHKPGTPAERTLEVAASAVAAHLAHGDYLGACEGLNAPPVDDEGKVTICHKPGTPAERTLEVAVSALAAHLAHGDALGSCEDLSDEMVTQPGTETEDDTESEGKVVICHKPESSNPQTLTVSASAVADHLAQGDTLGPCPETLDMAADAPWVARLVATALSIVMKLQAFAASLTS